MASYPALKLFYSGKLAAPSAYDLLNVWNLFSGWLDLTLWKDAYCIEQLASGNLAVVGSDNAIQVFNQQEALVISMDASVNRQYCLKQTATAAKFASCDKSGQIFIWSTTSTTSLKTLNGHTNTTVGLAVLANGQVVSVSWDKTMKLWAITTQTSLASLNPLNSTLFCVQNVTNTSVVVGGASNQIAFVNVTSSNQFSVLNLVTLPCSFVNAFRVTYTNTLLIAMDNSQLGYYDMNTNQLTQVVYLGTGFVALDSLGICRFICTLNNICTRY
jgi:WD40 repeat protein